MENFILIGLIGVQWALFGYSLAFGPDGGGFIGDLSYLGLMGVGAEPFKTYSETIPHQAFMVFQAMFAIITPALIIGSWVERFKFSTFLVFSLLWATLVYDPVAHWVWGDGGWLKGLGALDFAGGTVVHINAGIAALAAALIIGKRKGYGTEAMIPHNLPMTVLGAGILWFGGSALMPAAPWPRMAWRPRPLATHFATCGAALGWMRRNGWSGANPPCWAWLRRRGRSGAITPAAGFVGPMSAIIIGIGAGFFCYMAVLVKPKLGYDDSLDVVGVHMVGGVWGALATGLFASKAVNDAGADGLFFGNPAQFGIQVVAVGVTLVYSFVISLILFKILDATMGLRVTRKKKRQVWILRNIRKPVTACNKERLI